jgi:YidC/Oxa1 family membrane protein insertase
MDFQRPVLIAAIAAVSFMLLLEWNKFQEAHKAVSANAEQVQPAAVGDDAPGSGDAPAAPVAVADNTQNVPTAAAVQVANQQIQLIDVYSDTLHVKIDPAGGDIVMAALREYPAKINQPDEPLVILTRTQDHLYIAQSGLVNDEGAFIEGGRANFSTAQNRYEMGSADNELAIDLTTEINGVKITKRYTFTRGEYLVGISYLVDNTSAQPWSAHMYGQIKRDTHEPVSSGGVGMMPFLGAATTTAEKNYLKMTFDDMIEKPHKETKTGGWIAMVQHYFISAWVPDHAANNLFYTTYQPATNTYLLGFTGPRVDIAPGSQGVLGTQFYVGPKDVSRLEQIAPYLDLTVDYGVLWWIAKPLFSLTHWIHSIVGNWGLAIIGLTLCVKAIFLWPSNLSYKSMAVMKKLAPKMQEMKEAYGDNPTKLREEMFKLYQKEGANPMLGCLPMIIQTPVFIALYWSLMESVDLRQAPFYGWIVDLSVQDPYFLLPLLMGASMWVQQKLNPPPADPMQQRIFQFMPIIFTGMFLFFPAGLVLYMLVNNLISMSHQFWIYKTMQKAGAK